MKKKVLSLVLVLSMLSSLLFSFPVVSEAANQIDGAGILTYDGNILKENTKSITASIPSLNEAYHSTKRMIDGSLSGDNYYKSNNSEDDYTDLVVTIALSGCYNIGQINIYERYIARYGVCSDSVTIKVGSPADMKTVVTDGKLGTKVKNDAAETIFSFYPAVSGNTIEITFAGTRGRGTSDECTYQIWEIEAYSGVNYGVIMYDGSPEAKIGAELCPIDENNENVTPEMKNGEFMAPAPFLAKALELDLVQEDSDVEFSSGTKSVRLTPDDGTYSKNGHIYAPAAKLCEELGIKYEAEANGLFFANSLSDIDWNDKKDFAVLTEQLRAVVYETPPTPEEVITQLKVNNPENKHPRLFFSDDMTVRELRRRIKYEPYKSWSDSIISRAETYISRMSAKPIRYEIPDGVRLIDVCERVLEDVENIGFAYLLTGDTKYSDKVVEAVMTVCAFSDWNPYHFLDVGHMAAAVALGYDWCYDKFTADQRTTVKNALVNYALKPVMEDYNEVSYRRRSFRWSSESTDAYPNNWIAICTGGTIMAVLAIGDEDLGSFSDAGKVITEGMERLKDLADSYLPDGGFLDGPDYWKFAMNFIGNTVGTMHTALGTDYGISRSPGFNVTFDWLAQLVGPKGAFNFDSADASYADSSEFLLFGELTGKRELISHRINHQFDKGTVTPVFKDILWYDGEDCSSSELPLDYHSRGATNLSVLKTGNDDSDTWAAMYAGYRKKASGAMQDFDGAFVFDMNGKRWALDYGTESQTYHSTGYSYTDYYICRPEGHNTVIISETPAYAHDSGHDSDACGTLIKALSNDRMAMAVYDLTDQLDDYGAKSWTRGMKLDRATNKIIVQDELDINGTAPFYWFMHTEAGIEITDDGKGAILSLGGDKIKASLVTDDESLVFTVMNPDPLPSSPNPSNQESREGTRKLTIHSDSVTKVGMAVEFVPYYDEDESIYTDAFTPMSEWTLTESSVTVIGSYSSASGTGNYSAGETVTVDAGTRTDAEFDGWDAEGIVLDDPSDPIQTFIMPGGSVRLKAKWSYVTTAASFFDINFENWDSYSSLFNSDGTRSGFSWYTNMQKTGAEVVTDDVRESKCLMFPMSSFMSGLSYVNAYRYMDSNYYAFPTDKVIWGEFSVKFEGGFTAVGYDHKQGYAPICISHTGAVRRFCRNAAVQLDQGDKPDMYQLELGKWYHIVWAMDCSRAPRGDGGLLYAWVNGTKIINGTDYSSAFKTAKDGEELFRYYRLYVDKPKSGSSTVYLDNLKGYATYELDDHASDDFKEKIHINGKFIEDLEKVYIPLSTKAVEIKDEFSPQNATVTRDGALLSPSDIVMKGDTINVSASDGVGLWKYEAIPIDTFEMIDDSLYMEAAKFYIDCINLSDEDIKAKLFVANYDGTRLEEISDLKDITISPGKGEIDGDISCIESGESYKVFIWDSTETIRPLCKSREFTKKN